MNQPVRQRLPRSQRRRSRRSLPRAGRNIRFDSLENRWLLAADLDLNLPMLGDMDWDRDVDFDDIGPFVQLLDPSAVGLRGVPEPATWCLAMLGLGLMLTTFRREV